MCLKNKNKPKPLAVLPEPEKPAEEQEIGATRKKEDQELFGADTPQLRTDRSSTSGGTTATGTGLRMM